MVQEKVVELAKQKLEEINKQKAEAGEAKKEEGKQGTPLVPSPGADTKTKEQQEAAEKQKQVEGAKKQAEEDEKILSLADKDLNEAQKKRKEELKKAVAEEKAKWQVEVDKRFGSLKAELEELKKDKEANKSRIDQLEKERLDLEQKLHPPKVTDDDIVRKAEQDRIKKYLEEDKEKPREHRRELSKEELDEWLLEDFGAAQEWLTERSLRRAGERHNTKNYITFVRKQTESAIRTEKRHPELNTLTREKELKAEGKTQKEIFDVLCKENDKYRICAEIAKKQPSLMEEENGPELIIAEMEKALSSQGVKTKSEEEIDAEVTRRVQDELDRRANVDVGVNSSKLGKPKVPSGTKTEFQVKQEAVAAKAGITPERLREINERRKKIPGASLGREEEE